MNLTKVQYIVLTIAFVSSVAATGAEETSKEVKDVLEQTMIKNGDINKRCISDNNGETENISVEQIKLNHDSQPEYQVSGNGSCCGGARRCNQWIYKKSGTKYIKIFGDKEGMQGDVEILKSKTKGYRDIAGMMYGGQEAERAIYKYNGSVYLQVGPSELVLFR